MGLLIWLVIGAGGFVLLSGGKVDFKSRIKELLRKKNLVSKISDETVDKFTEAEASQFYIWLSQYVQIKPIEPGNFLKNQIEAIFKKYNL